MFFQFFTSETKFGVPFRTFSFGIYKTIVVSFFGFFCTLAFSRALKQYLLEYFLGVFVKFGYFFAYLKKCILLKRFFSF